MPPQNQTPVVSPPQTPQSKPDQYDFFLNPPSPTKSPLLRSNSRSTRLLVIIGGVTLLVIIVIVAISLLGGSGNVNPSIAVAQDQTELSRVAAEANGQTTVQTTLNLAESIQLSLGSSQQQWLSYLKTNGHKLSTAQLSATKNIATDNQLKTAETASNFDPVFDQVIQTELTSYEHDIRSAYTTVGTKGKAQLQADYNGAVLLAKQAGSTASSLPSQ